MQAVHALAILEAAYDLSKTDQEAIRRIARAAADAIPRGPVTVAHFIADAQLDPTAVHFERADKRHVSRFFTWQQAAPIDVRRFALSLTPRAVCVQPGACEPLPAEQGTMAHMVSGLCIMANTGDGGGLHVTFGDPAPSDWRPTRICHFHEIARLLAAAWRIRKALRRAAAPLATAAEVRVDAPPCDLGLDAPAPTARDALRRAVLARERARTGRRPAGDQELWPGLLSGRWSLLDAFTAAGTRYIIAYENPAGSTILRALSARERSVLEFTLAGRSGKWTACELQRSESAVTRTLRTALRRLGAGELTALSGLRTARFESLDGLNAGVKLAVARLIPTAPSLASLSDAERAVVAGILGGKVNAAIARERGTSPRTVAHQIASTYQKLGVCSRRELIALFT